MEVTELVGVVLLLGVLVAVAGLIVRRLQLLRGGGVDVSLRRRVDGPDGAGWHVGVGRYRGDELAWFRLVSLWPGPTVVVDRTVLEIVDRRAPTLAEVDAVTGVVLRCRTPTRSLELAMAPGVLTGFLAWLEATPPGRTGYRQAS